jgi:hypothetical protein
MTRPATRCLLVSHFHWDREWYRTFQTYRARLVDAVDRVLEILGDDPGCRFVLDGQVVLLEDYLALRPHRRGDLARAVEQGRLAIGPWYVQPDSFLPSGESHVRNLLAGRRTGAPFGPLSRIAYLPDSFGHPAQMPQLFAGFGLDPFVYWRGNGDELDRTGPRYRWVAPDGSAVTAVALTEGYFNAAFLPLDVDAAARGLAGVASRLVAAGADPAVLMNGFDHMPPDAHAGAVAERMAAATGWEVRRGLLDALRDEAGVPVAEYAGPLDGARLANLLPGVWSARMPIKVAARRLEALLEGWLEPWTALAPALGLPDERPALALAWDTLLACQAHDSIGGCAIDDVAVQVETRLAEALDLGRRTLDRLLGRLAGLGTERCVPLSEEQTVVVFNPSPHARTDVVRVPLEDYPALRLPLGGPALGPLTLATLGPVGFAVDGAPARLVAASDPTRARWVPGQQPLDLEFVARDVPSLGCRRYRMTRVAPAPDDVDHGREIAAGDTRVRVADDGTVEVHLDGRAWRGLGAVEDRGDRGDTYDFDAVEGDAGATMTDLSVTRSRHPSGIACLTSRRRFEVPRALSADRRGRDASTASAVVEIEARIAPGVDRVDLSVRVENGARDHRLRLLFPTGTPTAEAVAATTFDVMRRPVGARAATRWVHPAPRTFPHQGWVHAGGLTVSAPGLPEAEVTADGTIAITVLRCVSHLARFDLACRPLPAGPEMPVPGAQLVGSFAAQMSLLAGGDAAVARAGELGLRAVLGGDAVHLESGRALLGIAPCSLLLSALKPAACGDGVVLRLLNPTASSIDAEIALGWPVARANPVRLDEEPAAWTLRLDGTTLRCSVPAHALRSIWLR